MGFKASLRRCPLLPRNPLPVADFRHVFAMFAHVALVKCQLLLEFASQRSHDIIGERQPLDSPDGEMKSVQFVQDGHVERRGRCSLFDEAMHVKVGMIGAFIDQPVNEVGIAVISKDYGPVGRENPVEFLVGNTVRVVLR